MDNNEECIRMMLMILMIGLNHLIRNQIGQYCAIISEPTLQVQGEDTPAHSAMSENQNFDNFYVPLIALLDGKCNIFIHPIPKKPR